MKRFFSALLCAAALTGTLAVPAAGAASTDTTLRVGLTVGGASSFISRKRVFRRSRSFCCGRTGLDAADKIPASVISRNAGGELSCVRKRRRFFRSFYYSIGHTGFSTGIFHISARSVIFLTENAAAGENCSVSAGCTHTLLHLSGRI